MRVAGAIRPPGDKSVTHRALLLAALADGESELTGALTATDVRRTATILRQLGAGVGPLREGARLRVRGRPWQKPEQTLHCGNSGTAARLLLGLLAGHPFATRLTGDASLRNRPMRRVTEPLGQMGASFRESGGGTLPITIQGRPLSGLEYRSPVASAQVKSALLFAGLVARKAVTVIEPWRSRDHTERLLAYLGFDVKVRNTQVTLDAQGAEPDMPRPFDLSVPGDPSSASFLAAAALMAEGGELTIEGVGVNPTRVGFLKVIERMGARVEQRDHREFGNEPVADLVVRPADLTGTEVTAAEVPSLVDEVPVLAVLASQAEGETVFREVGELRVKESNRLELIAANLRSVGVRAEVQGDSLVVGGSPGPPRGQVDTAGDHRLTMAFAVLGTLPGAQVTLSERSSAAVSYPGFFRDLAGIGANVA